MFCELRRCVWFFQGFDTGPNHSDGLTALLLHVSFDQSLLLEHLHRSQDSFWMEHIGGTDRGVCCGEVGRSFRSFRSLVDKAKIAIGRLLALISNQALAGWAFAVFTIANLAPRALTHHKWYRAQFPDYPPERRALIPGLW